LTLLILPCIITSTPPGGVDGRKAGREGWPLAESLRRTPALEVARKIAEENLAISI
jgi:hypothetical protein